MSAVATNEKASWGLRRRALASMGWTIAQLGGSQALRFAGNLILARLLYPEAFGVMAVIQTVITGIAMMSDVGIKPSIIRSQSENDQAFLDTAWTIQVLRGLMIWVVLTAAAGQIADFYASEEMASLIPLAAATAILAGLYPTKLYVAQKNLSLKRVVLIDLFAQITGLGTMVLLAVVLRGPLALVIGTLVGEAIKLSLYYLVLPGPTNRLRWDTEDVQKLLSFGQWITLGTIAGFVISHADKLVIGRLLNLEVLGIYNIAFFLATASTLLYRALIDSVLFPLYCKHPPWQSEKNFADISKARHGLSAIGFSAWAVLAIFGSQFIQLVYDDRYHRAGALLLLVSYATMPTLLWGSYGGCLLAAGESRKFFIVVAVTAVAQLIALFYGVYAFGIIGACLAPIAGTLAAAPLNLAYARRLGAWDIKHDVLFLSVGCAVIVASYFYNFRYLELAH
ncbi:oligosaccharide flippase family protein [Erythrobacter sp. sf7]|uniref:Oligosaccharide flippase family protein n=1 Tax=Erythrobacter fulvus TaxID=2987523 RepID=A0ABT5JM68_9SPHN|nr:oligosaccharide flippase family protein [Erythrobacter fulvus]MDC8753599.1 oligosaccharide flippase family protein [Erythrobacter fulvus]